MRSVAGMQSGESLALRDSALREADRTLVEVISSAQRTVAESIHRIETVQARIDAVADSSFDAGECARLLLDRHRELIAVLSDARAVASSKAVELQRLSVRYTG